MKKRILFIINPVSGVAKKHRIEKIIKEQMDPGRYDVNIAYSDYQGHSIQIAQEAVDAGYEIIVAVGGDGSINEVARALVGTDCVLGIIPAGSGNGLAHHLKLSFKPEEAVKVINQGKLSKIDTCRINDQLFVSIAGIGFDALVAEKFARCRRRGFMSYLRIILREFPMYKPDEYRIYMDGKLINTRSFFVSFANSDQFGYDKPIAPGASMHDGLIDVCVVEKPTRLQIPFLAYMFFTNRIKSLKSIKYFKAKEIRVEKRNTRVVNVDGEPLYMDNDLFIKVQPLSINLIIP